MARGKFRTDRERAQDEYNSAKAKADKLQKRFDKIKTEFERVSTQLDEAIKTRDFYAQHPLVDVNAAPVEDSATAEAAPEGANAAIEEPADTTTVVTDTEPVTDEQLG